MPELLIIDDLQFVIQRSARRESVSVIVERDGSLRMIAPEQTSLSRLEQVARSRQFWVYRKLAEKCMLTHPYTTKSFIDGEGFPYLGRSYRLMLVDTSVSQSGELIPPVCLRQGRFRLRRDAVARAREFFIDWYSARARWWIDEQVRRYAVHVGVKPKRIAIRDLGYRWGSCTSTSTVNFHWRTILLPASSIEYIVLHELVHLVEPHHNETFWQRVRQAMPDYEERKQWLALEGGKFILFADFTSA
jgi:predicted metal-dependent hydrolase